VAAQHQNRILCMRQCLSQLAGERHSPVPRIELLHLAAEREERPVHHFR
jgi:hypothetical protein